MLRCRSTHAPQAGREMKGTHVKLKLVLMSFLLALSLCGCNSNDFLRNSMDKMAPDDDEALAKECLTALRKGDFQERTKRFYPCWQKH